MFMWSHHFNSAVDQWNVANVWKFNGAFDITAFNNPLPWDMANTGAVDPSTDTPSNWMKWEGFLGDNYRHPFFFDLRQWQTSTARQDNLFYGGFWDSFRTCDWNGANC